jgi:hypothetical protein
LKSLLEMNTEILHLECPQNIALFPKRQWPFRNVRWTVVYWLLLTQYT